MIAPLFVFGALQGGCELQLDRRREPRDRASAEMDEDSAGRTGARDPAMLVRDAERALHRGDSLTFARSLVEALASNPTDAQVFALGGFFGLSYQIIQVTENVVADYAPRFFASGERIVYFSRLEREEEEYPGLRNVRYQAQVCAIDLDGGNPTVISDGRASDFFPDVSFDGKYVVCQRAEGDTLKGEWEAATGSLLYLYELETGQGRQMGAGVKAAGFPGEALGRPGRRQRVGEDQLAGRCPRFMPGSHEVLFVTLQRGFTGLLSTIDLETGEITLRYRKPLLDKMDEPFFPFLPSPFFDGSRIAFQSGLWSEKAVFVSDSVGEQTVRLTPEDLSERHPSPAPDNRTIVFVSDGAHGEELFVRRVDDTIRRQLTFEGSDKAFPAYSPDGRYVAFGGKPKGYPETDYEIYLLDLRAPVPRQQIAARVRDLARELGIDD